MATAADQCPTAGRRFSARPRRYGAEPLLLVAGLLQASCGEAPVSQQLPIRLADLVPRRAIEALSASDLAVGEDRSGSDTRVRRVPLGDIHRDAVVMKGRETVSISLILPERPWLDLAVGIDRQGTATFRIELQESGTSEESNTILDHTVSQANTWFPVPIDLASTPGKAVDLTLILESRDPDLLGYWGTAVVRSGADLTGENRPPSPDAVILIIADTLRADHVSWSGYSRDTTPFLASLAGSGLVFRDCIAQATWTKVSVASILTGLYPTSHGVHEKSDLLSDSTQTLTEVFREAGYATLALASNPLVGRSTNLQQGFEEFHESTSVLAASAKTSALLVDRLIPWIEAHRESPFFILLHVTDPHAPYEPLAPWDRAFAPPGNNRRLAEQRALLKPHLPSTRSVLAPTREDIEDAGLDPALYVRTEIDGYDGSIRGMDAAFQRLVEGLERLGLKSDALIVFVSDHGEEFLEHDGHSHGHTVYGELAQIPLFFWGPSFVPAGESIDHTVSSIDVMPTILEIAGLPIPERVQGTSLFPFFAGKAPPPADDWRPAITEKPMIREGHQLPGGTFQSLALHTEDWKLIRNRPSSPQHPEYELYDRRTDPLDQRDVAETNPQTVKKLAAKLEEWEARAVAARPDQPVGTSELDPDVEKVLRALGYVGEGS